MPHCGPVRDHAFRGAAHPEDVPLIDADYEAARNALAKEIASLRRASRDKTKVMKEWGII